MEVDKKCEMDKQDLDKGVFLCVDQLQEENCYIVLLNRFVSGRYYYVGVCQ